MDLEAHSYEISNDKFYVKFHVIYKITLQIAEQIPYEIRDFL